ncbi:flagellar biosynthesis protein FlhB [Poseidonibacter lekithochrous]|uniref:flagellar biosynthesis protein FlhB n=1 Tax=Poseidonibacter lekithochrous TaxID=1904463 RepID=UPI0008FCD22E|nr:flagellar biosynthesis protein FlhB [Poseidonibacter lekithochrous]QKJ24059.1 flagellar export apparatus, transmembrane gate complex, FlhB component [Poseidonibacter lekithochrous]
MADEDEKTEEPTDKKIEDAKKEGNVSKSMEVTGAAILFFGSLYILFFSSHTMGEIKKLMMFSYSFIGQELDNTVFYSLTYTVVMTMISSLLPLFALVILLTFVFNWVQFGMIVTPLKIDLQKLDPIKGMKNVFGLKKLIEAFKLTAKLTVIIIVMVLLFLFTGDMILAMMDKETMGTISTMIELTGYFLGAILLIIIIFAIIDFYFTKHYYMKSLRMSKQDIKDEYKNMDGDPLVKGRIRRIQMEMAQKRMMTEVPDADVVITNPTHYAVAMKYDNTVDSAPKIVAKGIDFIAIKIKDIAKENDIPIIENPALARALHDQIEIEQQIPSEFYKALAEIFSYVYELKKKR